MVKYKWMWFGLVLGGFVSKVDDSLFGSGLFIMKAVRMPYVVEIRKDIKKKKSLFKERYSKFYGQQGMHRILNLVL